jgi:hypothetical protein
MCVNILYLFPHFLKTSKRSFSTSIFPLHFCLYKILPKFLNPVLVGKTGDFYTPTSCLAFFLSFFVHLHLSETQGVQGGICQIQEKVACVNFHRCNQTRVNVAVTHYRGSTEETLLLDE